jgi:8-oxo-dGTP diphosphatase
MKLLKTIRDQDPVDPNDVKTREAARGIFFDNQGLIPLLYVRQHSYHKLPGGGVEEGEDLLQALVREVKEETGCEIKVLKELGQIKEYLSQWNLEKTSSCYLGTVTSKGEPTFTDDETAAGFELVWMTLDDAIRALESDDPQDYEGIFIQKRDLTFLKTAQTILQPKQGTRDEVRGTNSGPWTKGSSEGQRRKDIRPGTKVAIVLKQDQRTGKLTEGIVQDLLTSKADHPRGIKVRLTDGQVGRVQIIL